MFTSTALTFHQVYTREQLATQFGITDKTLNNGVFRPKGHDSVWLFVTESKTPDRTQYEDRLEGEYLHWDGQTQGRTDDLIITHLAKGIELLLFYRREKNEFGNYGFRYEGRFRYLSHEGAKPAHFLLQRVPPTVHLTTVATPSEILESLHNFNLQARRNVDRATSILRQTTYWVFDPQTGLFGPGKFVGFVGMSFNLYEEGHWGNSSGAVFSGGVTRAAIESTLGGFRDDPALSERLRDWGERLLGEGAFGNADPAKWQFVVLDVQKEELTDPEIVIGLEANQERSQGFISDPRLRKEIELHAMAAAERHFRDLGYECHDRSKTHPFDVECRSGDEVVYVEVKGTQGLGNQVILTAGEVEFARSNPGKMALFVLHSIEVDDPEQPSVKGGTVRLVKPWTVRDEDLAAISYMFNLPNN